MTSNFMNFFSNMIKRKENFEESSFEIENSNKKYIAMYHNIPVGITTIALDSNEIQNYNESFSKILNMDYPHAVGIDFKKIIFRNDVDKFLHWLKNFNDVSHDDGIEVRLISSETITVSSPFLSKINGLVISKSENILILSVINIEKCESIKKRIDDDTNMIEGNFSIKNRFFVETYIKLKKELIEIINNNKLKVEVVESLNKIVQIIDDILTDNRNYALNEYKPTSLINTNNPNEFSSIRVLIVDDNEINKILTENMLKYFIAETTIEIVHTSKDALNKIKNYYYDIVFINLTMPMMDAYETIQIIRNSKSQYYNPTIPVVAMTSEKIEIDTLNTVYIGINDYIKTPVSVEEVVSIIRRWL